MPTARAPASRRITAATLATIALVLAPAVRAAPAVDTPRSEHGVAGSWSRPHGGTVLAPFDPPAHDWLAGHRGVDLEAPVGAVVRSPADGVVTFSGPVAGRGVLVVTHGGGLRTSFEPVDATVPRGTRVRAGTPVATLAATAGHCAPTSCLHWGVRAGETYIDPLALLERPRIILLGRRLSRARPRPGGRVDEPSRRCASARSATR